MRTEAGTGREILLDTTIDTGGEVELNMEPFLGAEVLGGVLVQHDHDLGHVVELADQGHILHGAAPLLILTNKSKR